MEEKFWGVGEKGDNYLKKIIKYIQLVEKNDKI